MVCSKTWHWGAEKINAVNYLSKPPPPNDECNYEEDFYAVNEQTGGFQSRTKGSNKENWHQGRIYGNYIREVHYVRDGNYNNDKNFKTGNYGNTNDMFLLKIVKLLLRMVEVVWCELRICCTK